MGYSAANYVESLIARKRGVGALSQAGRDRHTLNCMANVHAAGLRAGAESSFCCKWVPSSNFFSQRQQLKQGAFSRQVMVPESDSEKFLWR